ncbi:blue light receptor [Ceratobasidium sp. 428]|nr:blue light receptor [Ceratobasidium sp. 428]
MLNLRWMTTVRQREVSDVPIEHTGSGSAAINPVSEGWGSVHVLDSALTNFSSLRKQAERSHLRLALQTTIGTNVTLVYITPDTWPAVASRAKVVTVLVQRQSPTPSHSSPNPAARAPPLAVTHRVASPVRESETRSWPASPPQGTSWHAAYPPSAYPASAAQPSSSPTRSTARPPAHSRQHSQSTGPVASGSAAHLPYASMHHLPALPNAISPTTDLSFIGVRQLTDTELRGERTGGHHAVSGKRHWDQVDDAGSDERTPYARPTPDLVGGSHPESVRSRDYAGPSQHPDDSSRKHKRQRAWNPPDHQYSCRRCQRTDSPAWRKGPDGPKTLCNACGLSYAKELARRDAAASAATPQQQPQQQQQSQALSPPERSTAGYGYSSGGAAHSSRSARTTGMKTLDGSDATLATPEGSFSGPSTSGAQVAQPGRECSVCHRTDSPQWRKGPNGPNTLCNSCGLAWARTQRKPEGASERPGSSRSPSPTAIPPTYHQAAPLPRTPNGHRIRSHSAESHPAESPPNVESEAP